MAMLRKSVMETHMAITGLIILAVAVAFALAPRDEIVTRVDIAGSPEQVWQVLTDGARYGQWNPFLVAMDGRLEEGGRIANRMRPANGREMTFRPLVLRVVPAQELRWRGRLIAPRVFDGEHYFLLQPVPGGTRLIHGEKFCGIALWFMKVAPFRADFERMNAALKARVETIQSNIA